MTGTNLALWDKLGKTDPNHTKGFKRAGGFGGTAIKPIYTEQKMTEHFGPCGVGWGISEPVYQVVPASEGQIAVYCTTSIWINHEGKVSAPIYGVGGDLVVVKQSSGLRTDDEAFKKAFTDAVGNAMKHLGMSADVHMGRFDDSKYVSELREEFAEVTPPAGPKKQLVKVTREAWVDMRNEVDACATVDELKAKWRSSMFQDEFEKLGQTYKEGIIEHINVRTKQLTEGPPVEVMDKANRAAVDPDFSRFEQLEEVP